MSHSRAETVWHRPSATSRLRFAGSPCAAEELENGLAGVDSIADASPKVGHLSLVLLALLPFAYLLPRTASH